MKKLIGILMVFVLLMGFVSCNSNAITAEDGVGEVSFKQMQAAATKSLNATVTHSISKESLYWRYSAVKLDKGGKTGYTDTDKDSIDITKSKPVVGSSTTDPETWNAGLDQTNTFSVGTWRFVLYAFNGKPSSSSEFAAKYIYKGTTDATVTAGTVNTITVGVSGVSESGLNGTISFENITKADFDNDAVLKYRVDGTGSWGTTASISATPGSHTANVGIFDGSDIAYQTPIVEASIVVPVYRGLTTKVSGSIDDMTTGVNFNPGMPTTEATITTSANPPDAGTSPAVNVTAKVSPSVVGSTTNHETSVSIPQGAINTSAGTGDTFKSEVTVKSYAVDVASSTFQVKTSDDVAVAGIDCKMTVSINGGDATEVTDFQGSTPVTITTYILKNLESPKIYYDGDSSKAKPVAVNGASGQVSKETRVANGEIDVYATGDVPDGYVGYSKTTGKLVYTTTHFSTFHVEMAAAAYIKETNTAYTTVAAAVAAVDDSSTQNVVVLKNISDGVGITVNESLVLDFNGKTYTAKTTPVDGAVFKVASGKTVTFKNGTINLASTGLAAGFGYVVDNYGALTVEGASLDGTNLNNTNKYTVSSKLGSVTFTKGTNIVGATGAYAVDCYYATNSTSNTVTFASDFTGTVTGKIRFDRANAVTTVGTHALVVDCTTGTFDSASIEIVRNSLLSNEDVKSKVDTITLTNDNYIWVYLSDNYYHAETGVAKIGDVCYETLDAAINAAETNQTTIVMLKNVTSGQHDGSGYDLASSYTIDYGYLIPDNADITLDLNGKTIRAATVDEDEDITTFYNRGKLTITDSSSNNDGKIYNSWAHDRSLRCGCGIYSEKGSTLTVNGGNIEVVGAYGIYLSSLNQDGKRTTLNVNGGKILGGYYGIFTSEISACDQSTGWYTVYQNNGLNVNVTGGEIYSLGTHSNGSTPPTAYFGTAIETYCVNEMNISGGTIGEMHQDETSYINGIDCWRGTVNITGGTIIAYLQNEFGENGVAITANGQFGNADNKVTINIGGSSDAVNITSNKGALYMQQSNAIVNIVGNTNMTGWIFSQPFSTLNITGGSVDLTSSSISLNVQSTMSITGGTVNLASQISVNSASTLNISGGTINVAGNSATQYGIYCQSSGTVDISGGEMNFTSTNTTSTNKNYGVYIYQGNLTISSGVINCRSAVKNYGIGIGSKASTIGITGGEINVTGLTGSPTSYGIYSWKQGVSVSGVTFNVSGSDYNENVYIVTVN